MLILEKSSGEIADTAVLGKNTDEVTLRLHSRRSA